MKEVIDISNGEDSANSKVIIDLDGVEVVEGQIIDVSDPNSKEEVD